MDKIIISRYKFFGLKNLLLLLILGFLGIIVYTLVNKSYWISITFLFMLFLFMYFTGKKVAPIFLEKRILLYIKKNSGVVNIEQLCSIFDYSDGTMKLLMERLFADELIEIAKNGKLMITEKGVKRLIVWGGEIGNGVTP